jgi:hypothetical protein
MDLGDWAVSTRDSDALSALDGVEEIGESPGGFRGRDGSHEASISDNQIRPLRIPGFRGSGPPAMVAGRFAWWYLRPTKDLANLI